MSDLTPAVQNKLDEMATQINQAARTTAVSVLFIGTRLNEARALLGPRFHAWVEDEFAWSRSHTHRLMQAAEVFAPLAKSLVKMFEPTSLYMLSRAETPPEARVLAVQTAESGNRVTASVAKEIVSSLRATVKKGDVKDYSFIRKELDDDKKDRPQPEDMRFQLKAWVAFKELVDGSNCVRVERMLDADGADDALAHPYLVTVYPSDDGRNVEKFISKDGLEGAVIQATGKQPVRKCGKCLQPFPLYDGFSRKNGSPDGRATWCRGCEKKRVHTAKTKRRAKRSQLTFEA